MDKKSEISNKRKVLFYLGTVLQIIGGILFLSVFFSFNGLMNQNLIDSGWGFGPNEVMAQMMLRSTIGIVLLIVGSLIQRVGRRGLAGSGLILDPEKARDDLKPHTKAVGGMIQDALEEVDVLNKPKTELIKVRCPHCRELNEENAKFCSHCGQEL